MKRLFSLPVLIVSVVLLFVNTFYCKAQWVYNNWYSNKEEVFRLAKEQDRYIFLFVGLNGCKVCERTSTYFGDPENQLGSYIADNYIPWTIKTYDKNVYSIQNDTVVNFIIDIVGKGAKTFPFLFVINPDFPDSYLKWLDGLPDFPSSIDKLKDLITVDLLSNSTLTWYKNKEQVFNLANAQNKYIFKLVGKGTSPNSQKVIKLLNLSSLKDVLNTNYILWYSSDVSEANLDAKTRAGEEEEEVIKTLPYISIIYPEAPDHLLEEVWGYQDEEMLEDILQKYTVSNEKILPVNKVSVLGNMLFVSNQTINEQIRIFSLSGQNIATIHKNDFSVSINASRFPKGILVIHSSSGWSTKILLQ